MSEQDRWHEQQGRYNLPTAGVERLPERGEQGYWSSGSLGAREQAGRHGSEVPQPGVVPLRPLTLGEILMSAVRLVRGNPPGTVGIAAVIMGVSGLIGIVVDLILGALANSTASTIANSSPQTGLAQLGGLFSSVLLGIVLVLVVSLLAGIILSGLITVAVARGILGGRPSIGEVWQVARPRLPAVIGASLLTAMIIIVMWVPWLILVIIAGASGSSALGVLVGVFGTIAMVCATIAVWVLLSLAASCVVLERLTAVQALRRSAALVRLGFWRVLGTSALTVLVTGVAALMIEIPFDLVKLALGGGFGGLGSSATASAAGVIVGGLGSVVASAITRPVAAAVSVLLYADLRMRYEQLQPVLLSAARGGQLTEQETAWLWLQTGVDSGGAERAAGHRGGDNAPAVPAYASASATTPQRQPSAQPADPFLHETYRRAVEPPGDEQLGPASAAVTAPALPPVGPGRGRHAAPRRPSGWQSGST